MIRFNHEIKPDPIYEGLISAVPIDSFTDYIHRWTLASEKFNVVDKINKIQLVFKQNLTNKELGNLIQFINRLGWFVSAYVIWENGKMVPKKFNSEEFEKNDLNKKLVLFQLESKFDIEVGVSAYNILYHTTPSINDPKIEKIGLVPKTLNKISTHPDRIYFCIQEEDLQQISELINKNNPEFKTFTWYKVDVKRANRHTGNIRFFRDPNFPDALYTLSNIHKDCLTKIKTFVV